MGAALGIVVGVFLAALVTHALSNQGIVFAVPWMQLVYFVLAAILVASWPRSYPPGGPPPERAQGASVRVDRSVRGPA
jgi:hypothetical protein